MPPRWPRIPDRSDPEYRKLDDRMNFAVHVLLYGACNSGVWFFHNLQNATWSWIVSFSGIWGVILLLHLLYITAIANYSVKS
jgi:Na+-driven multidrug efflux pump